MRNSLRRSFNCVLATLIVGLVSWLAPGGQPRADAGPAAPQLSAIRFYSQAELLGVHQSVFETLFLQPWDENHWEYPLDAAVWGRGVYLGKNQYGQEFELDVKVLAQVDLLKVPLEPSRRKWANDNAVTLAGVIGELRHAGTRVQVHGHIVSTRRADGGSSWRFWLCNTVSPDSALFKPPPPAPRLTEAPPCRATLVDATRGLRDGGDCVADCTRAKVDAVSSANQIYDIAVAAAVAQRDVAVQLAQQNRGIALVAAYNRQHDDMLAANEGVASCLLLCLPLAEAPPAPLVCAVLCTAAYATALALINSHLVSDLAAAENAYVAAINAANDSFNISLTAAENAYGVAVDAAVRSFARCVAGCPNPPPPGGGGGNVIQPEEP